MIIDQLILDSLTAQAKASLRLRMNLDLRNSPEDQSQRMLNAIEPGTVMPIHRHKKSSETVLCLRGHFEEYFYDEQGNLTDTIDMRPGGLMLNIPIGHMSRCGKRIYGRNDEKTGPARHPRGRYLLQFHPPGKESWPDRPLSNFAGDSDCPLGHSLLF